MCRASAPEGRRVRRGHTVVPRPRRSVHRRHPRTYVERFAGASSHRFIAEAHPTLSDSIALVHDDPLPAPTQRLIAAPRAIDVGPFASVHRRTVRVNSSPDRSRRLITGLLASRLVGPLASVRRRTARVASSPDCSLRCSSDHSRQFIARPRASVVRRTARVGSSPDRTSSISRTSMPSR
jgi:hypothetical protein